MKKTLLIVIALVIGSCFFFYSRLSAQKSLHTDLSLKYLVHEPAIRSAHPPVIILLHGYGSNETDLFGLKDKLPAGFLVIAARAPISIGNNAYEWFKIETVSDKSNDVDVYLDNSSRLIKNFIKEIVSRYHADPARVYLSGFSQGAIMSYQVGLAEPELLTGIAPLSGKLFTSLRPHIISSSSLQKLRIFIGHGTADNRIPYASAKDAAAYLKGKKLDVTFHTYERMGHSISAEELTDLQQWLTAK